jgi:hypothetical protein
MRGTRGVAWEAGGDPDGSSGGALNGYRQEVHP